MEFKLLYDQTDLLSYFAGIWYVFAIFLALIIVSGYFLFHALWGKRDLKFDASYIWLIIGGMGVPLFLGYLGVKNGYSLNKQIKSKIENVEFKVVEGYVENFYAWHIEQEANPDLYITPVDSFTINDIVFKYGEDEIYDLSDGFCETLDDGGPISRNGQYLKIYYFETEKKHPFFTKTVKRKAIFKIEEKIN